MVEKILPYDRSIVTQETYFWCGPASTQNVLNSRGVNASELEISRKTEALEGNAGWDDQDGTDSISQITTVLNEYLGGGYVTRMMPSDPPTAAQKDQLWDDLVRSINGGYGVVANIVAPPSNYPRGVKGSTSPAYSGGTVFHYVALMGYDDAGSRAVWVADSGFRPFGYWCSFDQLCSLIPPKGYTAKPVGSATVESDADTKAITDFIAAYLGPLSSDVKDIREQLCGAGCRDAGQYGGWKQLDQMTVVDALGDLRDRMVK
ncbi:C39 family peptidase [Gordonia sp. HY442]|uniref:C39 family peptidase n=1 Tax=Gordonia zhenghanii TaxID=2911516 RepID=UPI001F289088|nr:C39 family peptidase [Gordonia zhenghanii]MCF8605159.1 C39 family peptidase [Gordonia zhenghanii]